MLRVVGRLALHGQLRRARSGWRVCPWQLRFTLPSSQVQLQLLLGGAELRFGGQVPRFCDLTTD